MAETGAFTFDGKSIPIHAGDTLGSALHRAGVKAIARSLRYHRPRGLRCCTGSCASCLVDVDGIPNVAACMAPAVAGCEVSSQNTMGGAKRDLFAVVDKVYPKGFDPHDMMTRPALLNRVFLETVRFMSGVGKVPEDGGAVGVGAAQRHTLAVDELIVGGGLHGLRRAHETKGGRVLLVDEMPRLGGSAQWDPTEGDSKRLAASLPAHVEAWSGAVAFGVYGHVVGVVRDGDLWEVAARRVTVAPGRHDGLALFPNNDLPGVLSLRGAARLLHQHRVLPGSRVVGHGATLPAAFTQALAEMGGAVVAQGEVEEARGGTSLTSAKVGGHWVDCDAIVCNVPGTPRVELLQQAGCDLRFRGGVLTTASPSADGATSDPRMFARFTEAAA
jgi:sarcosine oxidase, subunit alpha